MPHRRHWSERTRVLLTLQLAVFLPAAALAAFTVYNLHSIQRHRAVEAALQRDFSRVLEITEKRLNEKARRMVEEARPGLPCPSEHAGDKLEEFLKKHSTFAHAFVYQPHHGVIVRSQPGHQDEADFQDE